MWTASVTATTGVQSTTRMPQTAATPAVTMEISGSTSPVTQLPMKPSPTAAAIWPQFISMGSYQTTIDLYHQTDISRTLTFDGLGVGPHVLQVRSPRGIATVDRFHVPAIEAATDLDCGAYCRYEEYDSALRFNGQVSTRPPPTSASMPKTLPAADM